MIPVTQHNNMHAMHRRQRIDGRWQAALTRRICSCKVSALGRLLSQHAAGLTVLLLSSHKTKAENAPMHWELVGRIASIGATQRTALHRHSRLLSHSPMVEERGEWEVTCSDEAGLTPNAAQCREGTGGDNGCD